MTATTLGPHRTSTIAVSGGIAALTLPNARLDEGDLTFLREWLDLLVRQAARWPLPETIVDATAEYESWLAEDPTP